MDDGDGRKIREKQSLELDRKGSISTSTRSRRSVYPGNLTHSALAGKTVICSGGGVWGDKVLIFWTVRHSSVTVRILPN